MGVIEEKVAELEARLAELEPVLQEAEDLRESIASLKAIVERENRAHDPRWTSRVEPRRPYVKLAERKEQIAAVLEKNPEATNSEIGDRLGITAARVGQIRQQM